MVPPTSPPDAAALPDVRIVPARCEDAAALLAVQREAFVSESALYPGIVLPPMAETLPDVEADIAAGAVLVAVAGPLLVGGVRAHLVDDVVHVGRLCVAPAWQRRGIGARLLGAAEALYPARWAELFTADRSRANLRLYRSLGWVEDRRVPFDDRIETVYLRKRLPALEAAEERTTPGADPGRPPAGLD